MGRAGSSIHARPGPLGRTFLGGENILNVINTKNSFEHCASAGIVVPKPGCIIFVISKRRSIKMAIAYSFAQGLMGKVAPLIYLSKIHHCCCLTVFSISNVTERLQLQTKKVARTLFTVGQLQVMVVNSEWSHPRPRHLPKVAYLLSSLSLSRLRHLMDTDVRRSLLSSNSPFTRTITPCKGGQLQKIIGGLRRLASSLPPT